MAHYSIPNLKPASGRISTRSLRPSKRRNSEATSFVIARSRATPIRSWASSFFNVQHPTPNVQRSTQIVERWTLDVGRWTFSVLRRVKGAWWPSRSSKLSSPRKWRGRFDSYPLRLLIFELRFSVADGPGAVPMISFAIRKSKIENWAERR